MKIIFTHLPKEHINNTILPKNKNHKKYLNEQTKQTYYIIFEWLCQIVLKINGVMDFT